MPQARAEPSCKQLGWKCWPILAVGILAGALVIWVMSPGPAPLLGDVEAALAVHRLFIRSGPEGESIAVIDDREFLVRAYTVDPQLEPKSDLHLTLRDADAVVGIDLTWQEGQARPDTNGVGEGAGYGEQVAAALAAIEMLTGVEYAAVADHISDGALAAPEFHSDRQGPWLVELVRAPIRPGEVDALVGFMLFHRTIGR